MFISELHTNLEEYWHVCKVPFPGLDPHSGYRRLGPALGQIERGTCVCLRWKPKALEGVLQSDFLYVRQRIDKTALPLKQHALSTVLLAWERAICKGYP